MSVNAAPFRSQSSATRDCLGNALIVQNILKHTSDHPMQNLELRLVNKLFNVECIRRIRKTHRKMIIEYHGLGRHDNAASPSGDDDCLFYYLLVNGHVIEHTVARRYYKFLIEVADIRVDELRMKWFHMVHNEDFETQMVHDDIMGELIKNQNLKVLTHMELLCKDGCVECRRHALGCKEYGPLQFGVLVSALRNQKRHFDTLIVWESLFWRIAVYCVENCESRRECLKRMKSFITPNITCDHLCLEVHHDPEETLAFGWSQMPVPQQAFPREIIEEMCRVWKVKSIGIKFSDEPIEFFCSSRWTCKNFFTEFLFTSDSCRKASSGIQLDHVDIDLGLCLFPGCGDQFDSPQACANILTNARRLLPTRKMRVVNFYDRLELDDRLLEHVLNTVWRDELLRNFQVTICHQITLTPSSIMFEVPETLVRRHRQLVCNSLPSTVRHTIKKRIEDFPITYNTIEYVGKQFVISDAVSRSSLIWEIYVERRELDATLAANGRHIETGFLKYFS